MFKWLNKIRLKGLPTKADTNVLVVDSNGDIGINSGLKGDITAGLKTLETTIMTNKSKIIGTLAAAFVGKALTRNFASGTLAKLGPIRIKAMTPEKDSFGV